MNLTKNHESRLHGIRVNDQWRIIFRRVDGRADDVKLADYQQEVKMLPQNRAPTHPGEIQIEAFLTPLGVAQVVFAAHLGVPVQRVNELVKGKRGVTPEAAWLLSQALGATPELWMHLQAAYDLGRTRHGKAVKPLRKVA